jgi:predicted NUDIX family NTP pyrophosphohydrolase
VSAGLVLYRVVPDEAAVLDGTAARDEAAARDEDTARAAAPPIEVLCAHMGGPLWARKDEHAWSFPKGELDDGEEPFAAARREFAEELGIAAPTGDYRRLGEYRYSSGKVVVLFAVEADVPADAIRPGTFELEWPPRSGRRQEFPEVDRVAWFRVPVARSKLVAGQAPALDDLERRLAGAW